MTAAVFIIMGIITARLLEKRRMRIAAVAHAVFFILFGFFILLIPEKGVFAVLAECMLPFFMVFEGRKPKARELVVIAVLCAIGVAGRCCRSSSPSWRL